MLPDRSFASCATFEGTDTRVRIGFWVEGRLGVGNLLEKPFLSCLARCVGGCVCVRAWGSVEGYLDLHWTFQWWLRRPRFSWENGDPVNRP